MSIRIAINGFGRIGRTITRELLKGGHNVELVAINDLTSVDTLAHPLQFDSVHGRLKEKVAVDGDYLTIDDKKIRVSAERDPAKLPWAEEKVDVVLECTGVFTDKAKAMAHIEAGARKVIISAPGKNVDATVVLGVNDEVITKDVQVVSCGSCTTNCLAPLAKVLNESVGIEKGQMTTVHAYTSDQRLLDAPHSDMRRARAAALSMVPTSTGAAVAVSLVLPALKGKLDGFAVRVPTPNVSLVDLTFVAGRDTTAEEINSIVKKAADGPLKGILSYETAPIVSIDLNGDSHSSIFDSQLTKVQSGNLVKVLSWYDNETGFSNRMIELAQKLGNL